MFKNYPSYPVTFLQKCWMCSGNESGFKLTYRDSGRLVHFSFLTMQFFLHCQNMTTSKYDIVFIRNKTIFCCYGSKRLFQYPCVMFYKKVLLLLHVNVNCLETRSFSLIILIHLDYMLFFFPCIYMLSTVL